MKKFLLSLAAVALASTAMAGTVTFDFVNNDYGMTRYSGTSQDYNANSVALCTYEGVTITNGAAGNDRLWSDGIRMYSGSSLIISATDATVTDVTITTKTASHAADNFSYTKNDNGTFTVAYTPTKNNSAIATMTVTYEANLSGDQKPAGLAYTETAFTVKYGDSFTAPTLTNPNNLAVVYNSTNPAVATVNANGVVTIESTGTTTIEATSAATAEYGAGYASYTITVVNSAINMPKLLAACNAAGDKCLVDFPMTVVYVNGAYCYVEDRMGNASLLYGSYGYKKGDVIPAGWVAEYAPYGGMAEFKMTTSPATSGTETVSYGSVEEVNATYVNRVLILNNVTFDAATPDATVANFTGKTADGTELTFRNNFKIASVEAGTYNVTAAVGIYAGTLQVYPIEYIAKAVNPEAGFVVPSTNAKNFTCVYEPKWAENDDRNTYVVTCEAATAVTLTFTIPAGYTECYVMNTEGTPMGGLKHMPVDAFNQMWGAYGMSLIKGDSLTLTPRNDYYEYMVVFGNNGEVPDSVMDDPTFVRVTIKPGQDAGTVGVAAIEAEGAAEYYNLNGVRVANPENGIYVKVVNGKAAKVIL